MTKSSGQTKGIIGGLALIVTLGLAYAQGTYLIELSPIATENYVDRVAGEPVKELQRQTMVIHLQALADRLANSRINLIDVNDRLVKNPGNPDAVQIRQILRDRINKMERDESVVTCRLRRLDFRDEICG